MAKLPPISAFGKDAKPEDDWTKLPIGEERRRYQNKLAQRKFRRKKQEEKMAKESEERHRPLPSLPLTFPTSVPPSPSPSQPLQTSHPSTSWQNPLPTPSIGLFQDFDQYYPPAIEPVYGEPFDTLEFSYKVMGIPLAAASEPVASTHYHPSDFSNFQNLEVENFPPNNNASPPADWSLSPTNTFPVEEVPVIGSGWQDPYLDWWPLGSEGMPDLSWQLEMMNGA